MATYSALAAVERTLQVLEVLAGEVDGVSVTELENRTRLPKSMVSRILSTLHEEKYVERDSKTRFYKLSMHFLSMSYRHINALGINDIFYPMLERAADRTGELIQLAVVKDSGMFFIDKIEGQNPLKVASMVGQKAPFHATAVGKVWLAGLSDREVSGVIGRTGMKAYTEKTITDLDELLTDLAEVRKRGYAIADEEINREVVAAAVPISLAGDVVAGLVVAAPHFKMAGDRLDELAQICKEEAAKFDTSLLKPFELGYRSKKLKERTIS